MEILKTVYGICYHRTKQEEYMKGKENEWMPAPMFKTWDIKSPKVSSVSFYPGYILAGESVNLVSITVDKPFFINGQWVEEIITPAEITELAKVKVNI